MKISHNYLFPFLFIAAQFCSGSVYAGIKIAILDFELNDITSLPNTPAEQLRTASIKPLLEQAIRNSGDYDIIQIPLDEQKSANFGFGYLFRFHDVAAQLGKKFGADWIIVGQHSKPSFLFSYLIAKIINVEKQRISQEFDIELKGNHVKVTERGVIRLAEKINDEISRGITKNIR